jgi:hypothetical protein
MSPNDMRILDGRLLAFVAFDVGFEIALDRATALLDAPRGIPLKLRRPAPPSMRYPAAPVEVSLEDHRLPDGTLAALGARIFDFGVVSFCFTLPSPPTLADLPGRGRLLVEEAGLREAAESALEDMLERLRPTVVRPDVEPVAEDYFVFQVSALEGSPTGAALVREHGGAIVSALALEPGPLDESYVAEVLARRVSYAPNDVVVCDWNAAFVYDRKYEDTVAVLEFLNIQLLELRVQDRRLDRALERFAGFTPARGGIGAFLNPYRQSVRELAELTIESTLLSERAINAMTLLGDDYLARVARAAAERLHLGDWVATVRRKQEAVAALHTTLNDRLTALRGEALELAIVILIVFEIVLFFSSE